MCYYTLYIYIFGSSVPPNGILPSAKFTLRFKSCAVLYWQRYCTALEQWQGGHHVKHRPTF